jgi:hypothetical protein
MSRPPQDIAKVMLQAAMQPYCTDVMPLTIGAHRIDYLEGAIRAFLDAQHEARFVIDPSGESLDRLRDSRDRLCRLIGWTPPR